MAATISSFHWDFGDGGIGTEKKPIHQYKMPGIYLVILTETDYFGNVLTAQHYEYMYQWDYVGAGMNVSTTDRCFRHALPQRIEQGVGWAEYEGREVEAGVSAWPYPEGLVGTCKIMNEDEEFIPLVIDSKTFEMHELGRADQWQDSESTKVEYGEEKAVGYEIDSEILLPEVIPPIGATAILGHSQTDVEVKPWYKDRIYVDGYGTNGFRLGFNMDLFVRKDSEPFDSAITKQVPLEGQLVFDREFKSKFLQTGVRIRYAPWRFVRTQTWYIQIDSAAPPDKKLMSEMVWQRELSAPLVWLTRNMNPLFNAATGQAVSGSFAGVTIGPDELTQSAVVFGINDSYIVPNVTLEGDFILWVWLRNPTDPITLFQIGGLTIVLDLVGSGYDLIWNDSGNNFTVNLSSNYKEWTFLTIVKNSGLIRVFENYNLINTVFLTDASLSYSGNLTLFQNAIQWFDMRAIPRAISGDCIQYCYRDIVEHKANSICPIFK